MLILTKQKCNAEPALAAVNIKKSGQHESALLVTLTLSEEIITEEQAEKLDDLVPGALKRFKASQQAQAAGRAETDLEGAAAGAAAASGQGGPLGRSINPVSDAGITLVMTQGDETLELKDCEVRSYEIKATAKTCAFIVKVRTESLMTGDIGILVGWLGEAPIQVTSERSQQAIPFRRKAPGEIGDVISCITDGCEYTGIIKNRGKDGDHDTFEIDDCGALYIVPASSVTGTVNVGGDRDVKVADFVAACKKAKVVPTWNALMIALGAVYLQGGGSGVWTLTDTIVQAAVQELLKEKKRVAQA